MNYTKKMMLVSPDMLQQKMSTKELSKKRSAPDEDSEEEYVPRKVDPVENLEKEMYSILKKRDTEDRDKWSLYYQLLQRYFRHMDEERKPLLQESDNTDQFEEEKIPKEQILEVMPVSLQRKASALLNWIDRSKGIKWNGTGEVSVGGKKISGSNIIDLVRDLLTERKIPPPTGMKEFCVSLKKLNVPDSLIPNRSRWANFTSGYRSSNAGVMSSPGTPSQTNQSISWSSLPATSTPSSRAAPSSSKSSSGHTSYTFSTPLSSKTPKSSSGRSLPTIRRVLKRERKANPKWASFERY
jgi:hypothetical protein